MLLISSAIGCTPTTEEVHNAVNLYENKLDLCQNYKNTPLTALHQSPPTQLTEAQLRVALSYLTLNSFKKCLEPEVTKLSGLLENTDKNEFEDIKWILSDDKDTLNAAQEEFSNLPPDIKGFFNSNEMAKRPFNSIEALDIYLQYMNRKISK